MPPCGLLIQKYLESGDGTPDEDASHERNCFRISMPKLQPDSVLASSYVSGCTFAVCRLISSVCMCVFSSSLGGRETEIALIEK